MSTLLTKKNFLLFPYPHTHHSSQPIPLSPSLRFFDITVEFVVLLGSLGTIDPDQSRIDKADADYF
jgi:hypothetical protein